MARRVVIRHVAGVAKTARVHRGRFSPLHRPKTRNTRMVSLIALASFLGLIVSGIALCVLPRGDATEANKQRRVSGFVLYVLIVSMVAGVSRRDLWPFSSWQLMVGDAPSRIGYDPDPQSLRIRAVDADGVDHPVDFRAWQPLSVEELSTWLIHYFPELPDSEQRVVASELLSMANLARGRAAEGGQPGSFDRVFGRWSAPYHLLHPRLWARSEDVPTTRFVGIRFYRESFDLEALSRGEPARLDLVYTYDEGPP